jgi:hypothetical protein
MRIEEIRVYSKAVPVVDGTYRISRSNVKELDSTIVEIVWRSVYTFYDKRVKGFRMHPSNYIFGEELAVQA